MKRIFMAMLFAALLFTGCNKEKKLVESMQGFWEVYQVMTPEGVENREPGQIVVVNEHNFYIGSSDGSGKVMVYGVIGYVSNDGKKITASESVDGLTINFSLETNGNDQLLITETIDDMSATALAKRVPAMEIVMSLPE